VKTPQGLFITGTDTGVGKTVLTAVLGAILESKKIDFGVFKPVQTGVSGGRAHDLVVYKWFFSPPGMDDEIIPSLFAAPQAPTIAAKLEGRSSSVEKIKRALYILEKRHQNMLIEGVGGLMVPISSRVTVLDFIEFCKVPALVVARPDLGTINHTLLTLGGLRKRKIKMAGFVMSKVENHPDRVFRSVVSEIERLSGSPFLGFLEKRRISKSGAGEIVKRAKRTLKLERLLRFFN